MSNNATIFSPKDKKCTGSSHWDSKWAKTLSDYTIIVQPIEGQNFFMYEDEDGKKYVDIGDDKPREWNEEKEIYEYT